MKIHAIQTGSVRVKHSFLYPGRGPRRQLGLFMPSAWSDPLPIYVWAIEHRGFSASWTPARRLRPATWCSRQWK